MIAERARPTSRVPVSLDPQLAKWLSAAATAPSLPCSFTRLGAQYGLRFLARAFGGGVSME